MTSTTRQLFRVYQVGGILRVIMPLKTENEIDPIGNSHQLNIKGKGSFSNHRAHRFTE